MTEKKSDENKLLAVFTKGAAAMAADKELNGVEFNSELVGIKAMFLLLVMQPKLCDWWKHFKRI